MRIGSVRAGMTVWGVSCRRAIRAVLPPAYLLSPPASAGSEGARRGRPSAGRGVPRQARAGAGDDAGSAARRRRAHPHESAPGARGTWTGTLLQFIDRRREFLPDPEERDYLGGDLDRRLLLRVASDPRPPVPDAEAPESPELDLVALGERLRDPVEDGVDDGLGFLLGDARQPRQRLDQAGFRHGRALEATVSVGTGQTRAHERPAKLVQVPGGRCQSAFGSTPG